MTLPEWLIAHDVRRAEFARRIGKSRAYVGELCDGRYWPSREVLERIVDVTESEVTPNDFLYLERHSAPGEQASFNWVRVEVKQRRRLQRRLQEYRKMAASYRDAERKCRTLALQADMDDDPIIEGESRQEAELNRVKAEAFERICGDLAHDLAARAPSPNRKGPEREIDPALREIEDETPF